MHKAHILVSTLFVAIAVATASVVDARHLHSFFNRHGQKHHNHHHGKHDDIKNSNYVVDSLKAKHSRLGSSNTQQIIMPIDRVDTRIGSGGWGWGCGAIPPGAQVPFGAIRLTPATSFLGLEPLKVPFDSEGGYAYTDAEMGYLECMVLTAVVGAGEAEWQNFGITAIRAPFDDVKKVVNAGYKSKVSHKTEHAQPGYYAVTLETPQVTVEATASGTLTGLQRYTCAENSTNACGILFDFCHASPRTGHLLDFGYACRFAQVTSFVMNSNRTSATIDVNIVNEGEFLRSCGGIPIYARFEVQLTSPGATFSQQQQPLFWRNGSFIGSSGDYTVSTTSGSSGVILPIDTSDGKNAPQVIVRAALSFINESLAKANLEKQQMNPATGTPYSFDEARSYAEGLWNERFAQFSISIDPSSRSYSGFDDTLTAFYSGIYRVFMSPTDYTETNGLYKTLDNQIGQVKKYKSNGRMARRLSDLSLWDTYRARQPLIHLVDPEQTANTVNSMLDMAKEMNRKNNGNDAGYLPMWVMANCETYTMVGMHAISIISDALQKNVSRDLIDYNEAFHHVVVATRQQNTRMPNNGAFGHYSPENGAGYGRGVGGTLEYSIIAAATQNLAQKVFNNESVANEMAPYAAASFNLFNNNSDRLYFCDRWSNGTFACPSKFDAYLPHPFEKGHFIESSAIQYRWYAPQNLPRLIELLGGAHKMASILDDFMQDTWLWPLNTTMPNVWWWAGNEPEMLIPFVFVASGDVTVSHRTNFWIDKILPSFFPAGPWAPSGNSDYGGLDSMYLHMMLGFYPIVPTTTYALFAPKWRRIDLNLPSSGNNSNSHGPKTAVRLLAHGLVDGVTNYLASAKVNGVSLATPLVTHEQLMSVAASGQTPTIEFFCVQQPVVFGDNDENNNNKKQPWMPRERTAAEEKQRKVFANTIAKRVIEEMKK